MNNKKAKGNTFPSFTKLYNLLNDLGWEYDRMSTDGQTTLNEIYYIVGREPIEDDLPLDTVQGNMKMTSKRLADEIEYMNNRVIEERMVRRKIVGGNILEIKVDDVEFTNLDDEIYDNLSWYCDMNLVDETPRLKNKFYEVRNKMVDFIESVRAEQVEGKDEI